MAAVKYIQFPKAGATGLQTITVVGFQGNAAIFWSTKMAAVDITHDVRWSQGMTDGTTHACREGMRDSAGLRTQIEVGSVVLRFSNTTPTALAAATFDSWTPDGLRLNWTVNDGGTEIIHCIVFDADDAALVRFKTDTSPQNVTSPGFTPDAIIWIPGADTGGSFTGYVAGDPFGGLQGFGFSNPATGDNNTCWVIPASHHGQSLRAADTPLVTGIFTGMVAVNSAATGQVADGFVAAANTGGGTECWMHVLCLAGIQVHVGQFQAPAAPGIATLTLPIRPQVVMFTTTDDTTQDAMSVGAWEDDGPQGCAGVGEDAGPTTSLRLHSDTECVKVVAAQATAATAPDRLAGRVVSRDGGVLSIDWTSTISGADINFAAFGVALEEEFETEADLSGKTVPLVWAEAYLPD